MISFRIAAVRGKLDVAVEGFQVGLGQCLAQLLLIEELARSNASAHT